MKFSGIQKAIFILGFVTIVYGCASMGTPTGGPKDEEHPLVVESDPPFNTINFDSKEIDITFNEFIQLKELNSNLIISPPMEEKPMIREKGKTLNIKFEEEFKDSTTYNIYFGNAVRDYNESNPIENFQYVLSTGSYIDSLSIEGYIINAFSLVPEEGVFVMLYTEHNDSIPIKEIPEYVSKTNKEGFFRLNNIAQNEYKLFCIRDFNKNYLFDLPNEEIAYIDSLVKFELITKTFTDTIYKVDSLQNEGIHAEFDDNETREIDSIISQTKTFYPVNNYTLRLFTEDREVQYLANNKRESKYKIEVMLNKPVNDSIIFALADTVINESWYLMEASSDMDSIIYWLTNPVLYKKENILTTLSYYREDTNQVLQWEADTLNFRYFEPKKKRKKDDDEEEEVFVEYALNVKNNATVNLNQTINFSFNTPIKTVNNNKINLIARVDSLEFPVDYKLLKDTIKPREFKINVDWSEDTIYRMEIYPGAFNDIYKFSNDTNIFEFKSQKRDYYGIVLADIIGVDSSFQAICQLLIPNKDGEQIIKQEIIKKDQLVKFDFLAPKEFIFKVILDKNFNNKWDTGDYLKNIQPEEVLYYTEKIKVRSNWDMEINFDLKKQ